MRRHPYRDKVLRQLDQIALLQKYYASVPQSPPQPAEGGEKEEKVIVPAEKPDKIAP